MRDIIRGGALVYGLLAAGCGVLLAFVFGLLAVVGDSGRPVVMATTISASMAALGVGLGLPLAVASWHSLHERPSPRLQLPPIWLAVLVLVACLGMGTLVLHFGAASALLLPPLHVVASAMPALILLAAVLPSLQAGGARITRRNFITLAAYGALFATVVAIMVEGVAAMVVMVLALVAVSITPGGQTSLERLSQQLQSPALLANPERMLDVVVSPALVLGIGLLVAVVTPLIEETVKSLGAWTEGSILGRLTRSQAFAFGVIIGCGFSLTEALFYGSAGLPQTWTSAVLVRSATTVIHATATGLVALGWYEVRRGLLRRALGFIAAGIGLHVLWNGAAGLSAVASLRLLGTDAVARVLETALLAFANAMLIALFFAAIAVLVMLTRQMRRAGSEGA